MASQQASQLAMQGLGYLFSATKASVSAISTGINKAVKSYADYYEKDQIESLKKSGKNPIDLVFAVLQRFHYLSMAGYDNEVAAASQKAAARLTMPEKTSIPLDAVISMGRILTDTAGRYGDASKGSWLGLQDFLNSGRMGKDHFDRDQLVSDFYYTMLYLFESCGGMNSEFERALQTLGRRLVEGEGASSFGSFPSSSSSSTSYSSATPSIPSAYGRSANNPTAYGQSNALPAYAQVSPYSVANSSLPSYAQVQPAAAPPPAAAPTSVSSSMSSISLSSSAASRDMDPKKRAAKVLSVLASSIKKAGDEGDIRRLKSVRDAEDLLKQEKERGAAAAYRPY
eukprot:TRINITY_DN3209_c0_g3_i1.p1 TRINITY_DN3209_c0_g3~~TRINITY_DN3209_c0_g3_i1.p1  ORF type:complete len:376 (+),score=84.50 TRINITY_DN3209_c0_g3_i1:106-1128(+)